VLKNSRNIVWQIQARPWQPERHFAPLKLNKR
jgi:hypothetical protein